MTGPTDRPADRADACRTGLAERPGRRRGPSGAGARTAIRRWLTFSNQARVQLEREAERQLSVVQRRRIEVTNYHRFFWRAVQSYRRALGLPLAIDIGGTARRRRALESIAPGK